MPTREGDSARQPAFESRAGISRCDQAARARLAPILPHLKKVAVGVLARLPPFLSEPWKPRWINPYDPPASFGNTVAGRKQSTNAPLKQHHKGLRGQHSPLAPNFPSVARSIK